MGKKGGKKKGHLAQLRALPRSPHARDSIRIALFLHRCYGNGDRPSQLYCLQSGGAIVGREYLPHGIKSNGVDRVGVHQHDGGVTQALVEKIVRGFLFTLGYIPRTITCNSSKVVRLLAPMLAALGNVALVHSGEDALMTEMVASFSKALSGEDGWSDDRPGFMDIPGVTPDVLSLVCQAASRFWGSRCWQTLHTGNIFEIKVPAHLRVKRPLATSALQTSRHCGLCGRADSTAAPLVRCAGCKQALYCDAGCQRGAWKTHKKQCKKAKAVGRHQVVAEVDDDGEVWSSSVFVQVLGKGGFCSPMVNVYV